MTNTTNKNESQIISYFSSEFLDSEKENLFRLRGLAEAIRQNRFALSFYLVFSLLFFFTDFLLIKSSLSYQALFGARLAHYLFSLWIFLQLPGITFPKQQDRSVLIWWLSLIGLSFWVNLTRPPDYLHHVSIDTIIIFATYLLFYNRFIYQLIPALVYSLGNICIILFYKQLPTAVSITIVSASFLMSNIIGAYASHRFHRFRRLEYTFLQQEKALKAQLERQANTDVLTGLYNRRYLLDELTREHKRAHRYASTFTLMMLDLDHFKQLNDQHGHDIGDQALIKFSDMLKDSTRQTDVLGRFGGEEFLILLPETQVKDAERLAKRILTRCQTIALQTPTKELHFSVSIGLTEFQQADQELQQVIKRADEALYKAKEVRNQFSTL